MIVPVGVRLVQACESLCADLRRSVGLTVFRVALDRRTTPLVITLRSSDIAFHDPRNQWLRPALPARIQVPLAKGERCIGELRIEDERRAAYPAEALDDAARIAAQYASEIAGLIEEAQL